MDIAGHTIGLRPYIVADLSCNHLGSLAVARELISLAKRVGADAVKPQLYTADELCKPGTIATDGPWKGRDMYELYKEFHMPRSWLPQLFEDAEKEEITLFFSVFSVDGVKHLETLGCPAYKISTSDYNWTALREACAATGKPVMISVPYFREGEPEIQLLNRPGYPCPFESADMGQLRQKGVYGFSTHVMDRRAFPMAVALGATIIELNLMRSGWDKSPDASFSFPPAEFEQVVRDCREAWQAMRPQTKKEPSMIREESSGLRRYA